MSKKFLTIGKLAKQANINIETIRYYQKRGLIVEPQKPQQGYRVYSKEVLLQLLYIQRAKLTGFTLNEIKELLTLDETNNCKEAQQMAEQKLILVNKKLDELLQVKSTLEIFINDCRENTSSKKCGIIQSFKNNL